MNLTHVCHQFLLEIGSPWVLCVVANVFFGSQCKNINKFYSISDGIFVKYWFKLFEKVIISSKV